VHLPYASLGRALVAAVAAFAAARAVPQSSGWFAPVALGAGVLAYVSVLFVARELGPRELAPLLARLRRRPAHG
jgi:hypothetical protein